MDEKTKATLFPVAQYVAGIDYGNFPFADFTVAETFALAQESKDIGDTEFVTACMEAIRLNKCKQTAICHDARETHAERMTRWMYF